MAHIAFYHIVAGLRQGSVVPVLGPGALAGAVHADTGAPMPADHESLTLALNDHLPEHSPDHPPDHLPLSRLMPESSRAGPSEQPRGHGPLARSLDRIYGATAWTRAPLHDWLAAIAPRYVIDLNRDTQLQDSYRTVPHLLVMGTVGLADSERRFRVYHYDGCAYRETEPPACDPALPVLFKPLGSPRPEPSYVIADADLVDYLTEFTAGCAIPPFLQQYRKGKRYLLLGLRLKREIERLLVKELIADAAPAAGWAFIPDPGDQEQRFCSRLGLDIIAADTQDLLDAEDWPLREQDLEETQLTGC